MSSGRAVVVSPGRRGADSGPSASPSATISSTDRTDGPSATMRWASRSIAPPSVRPSGARAWPAEKDPGDAALNEAGAATRRVLLTWGRGASDPAGEFFLRAPGSHRVVAGGRGLLERVELAAVEVLQASRSRSSSAVSRMIAGMALGPASPAARHRRSPMTSS